MKNMRNILIFCLVLLSLSVLSGCKKNDNVGDFYNLITAYEEGLITKEDLKSIACYYNGKEVDGFNPKPMNPEKIDKRSQKLIKKMYLEKILDGKKTNINKVQIYNYYGNYNGNIALTISDDYYAYDYVCYDEYIIDDIIFYNYYESYIKIFAFKRNDK